MAKNNQGLIIAIAVIIAIVVISSGFQLSDINLGGFGVTDSGLVSVDKQIKFHVLYKYGGSPVASKTDKFNLYDASGENVLEANLDTDANGLITTGSGYPSGESLYLRYEDGSDKQWWKFTVPKMNKADAESATYNLIDIYGFTIGTYTTDALKCANGTSIADAGTYNITASGANPHFTYSLANTGSDNTGIIESYDPLYDQNWNIEVYIAFSGTDYEKLIIYDLSYDFTLGTTHYVGTTADGYKLTKHKVGSSYKSLGTQDFSFWIDTTSTTVAVTSVTMQITVKAYADHSYAQSHGGSMGPEAVEIAEHTVTIAG